MAWPHLSHFQVAVCVVTLILPSNPFPSQGRPKPSFIGRPDSSYRAGTTASRGFFSPCCSVECDSCCQSLSAKVVIFWKRKQMSCVIQLHNLLEVQIRWLETDQCSCFATQKYVLMLALGPVCGWETRRREPVLWNRSWWTQNELPIFNGEDN